MPEGHVARENDFDFVEIEGSNREQDDGHNELYTTRTFLQ